MAQPAPLNQNLPGKGTGVITGQGQQDREGSGGAEPSRPVPMGFLIPAPTP